jgi:hypothetical protein
MNSKEKKKLTSKEVTKQLSNLIGKQLESIPPRERRRKTESVYKKLLARIRAGKVSTLEIV